MVCMTGRFSDKSKFERSEEPHISRMLTFKFWQMLTAHVMESVLMFDGHAYAYMQMSMLELQLAGICFAVAS